MAVGNRAAFNIDNVLGQAQFLRQRNGNGREGLVDLDPLDIPDAPSRPLKRLTHSRHGPKSKHSWFNGAHAVGDQLCEWRELTLFGPFGIGNDHGGCPAVQPRRVARGNGAVLPKGRLQFRQRFFCRVRTVMLVPLEHDGPFGPRDFEWEDFSLEATSRLCLAKSSLGPQGPGILRLACNLEFRDEILSMPALVLSGEGVVQAVAQHAVIDLRIAHAVTPTA